MMDTAANHTPYPAAILAAAFRRSLGHEPQLVPFAGGHVMLCGTASSWTHGAPLRGKAVIFGTPTEDMLPVLGLRHETALPSLDGADVCPPACDNTPFTESPAYLAYAPHGLLGGLAGHMRQRPFCRFDYTDEWNNLGFGRIRTDDSPWGVRQRYVTDTAVELAAMRLRGEDGGSTYAGAYLTLHDTADASILWCARPVGPVDSTEWTIVEHFLSDWRPDDMPCLPVLSQVPAGCRCLVTMRLDCDEAVASAEDLFHWYRSKGLPFSLALKTSLDLSPEDRALLRAVHDAGGSVLSHSHTHPLNWGASPEEAAQEAAASRARLEELFPDGQSDTLAVSPFHSNPPYAVRALEETGYTGFVSGIIHNDPEYLLGRAGVVPLAGAEKGIVSISQQAMLHGDCYRRQGCSVDTHVLAFEAQYQARGIFGYLDHPFSPRYQYDWASEGQRLAAHKKLVQRILSYPGVHFVAQHACFDFVRAVADARICVTAADGLALEDPPLRKDIACRYQGHYHVVAELPICHNY